MALVTLAQAIGHLRLTGTFVVGSSPIDPVETDLTLKLAQAEDVVLNYLKIPAISPEHWTIEPDQINTVPPLVQAAILLQLGELWRFRGDDVDGQGPAQTAGDLSPTATNLLRRWRDPAVA